MDKLELTSFEENLYIASSSTQNLKKYKSMMILTALLFGIFFTFVEYLFENRYLINSIVTIYVLLNLVEVLRFAKIVRTYRTLTQKLAERLFGRTNSEAYQKVRSDAENISSYERSLTLWSLLLAVVFLALMFRGELFPFGNAIMIIVYIMGMTTIKLDIITKLSNYKEHVFELGKILSSLTYPEATATKKEEEKKA